MTRSPRRLKDQVRETVSELPIHAARFAVMGVGRALLLTDRVRKDYREARASGLGPVLGRLKGDAENITGTIVGKVTERVSGNGRAAAGPERETEISVGKPKAQARPAQKPAQKPTPKPAPKPAAGPPSRPAAASRPKPATAKATREKPAPSKAAGKPAPEAAAKPKPAAEKAPEKATEKAAEKKTAAKELPLSGYDEATLASVRARLRGLDVRQVAQLRDYERSNAARADFLRMYENRIAKLKGQR
jgi:hypothetical protein